MPFVHYTLCWTLDTMLDAGHSLYTMLDAGHLLYTILPLDPTLLAMGRWTLGTTLDAGPNACHHRRRTPWCYTLRCRTSCRRPLHMTGPFRRHSPVHSAPMAMMIRMIMAMMMMIMMAMAMAKVDDDGDDT